MTLRERAEKIVEELYMSKDTWESDILYVLAHLETITGKEGDDGA